jgi:hypothetical protein
VAKQGSEATETEGTQARKNDISQSNGQRKLEQRHKRPQGVQRSGVVLPASNRPVPDPGKGVCADPVNGGAILGKGGPDPQGGNKERQLSPDKGRDKT